MARFAEDAGFGAFFRSDHYLAMDGAGLPGPSDAWTTLAGLARETSRIRLGTLVTSATFRLPGPRAVQVAQVDHRLPGAAEAGIVGSPQEAIDTLGRYQEAGCSRVYLQTPGLPELDQLALIAEQVMPALG